MQPNSETSQKKTKETNDTFFFRKKHSLTPKKTSDPSRLNSVYRGYEDTMPAVATHRECVKKVTGTRSLQWWTTTRRPQRRPDFRRRRRTRPVDMVGHRAGHFLRPTRRAPSTCIVQAPQPQQQPQPRTQQSPATSRPQLVRSPLRPRSLRSPCLVPRSTTVP